MPVNLCRIYQVANVKSEWNCIKTFPDLSGTGYTFFPVVYYSFRVRWFLVCPVNNTQLEPLLSGKNTCVKFGSDSKYIAVGSMDRNLRIFGLPGEDAPTES